MQEYIDSLVDKSAGSDACWPFARKHCYSNGYGRITYNNMQYSPHKVMLQKSGVVVPKGKFVLHRCDNPPCCNPSHLRVGDVLDNARDRVMRGRGYRVKGLQNKTSRLTERQVSLSRKMAKQNLATTAQLAKKMNVCNATMVNALYGFSAYADPTISEPPLPRYVAGSKSPLVADSVKIDCLRTWWRKNPVSLEVAAKKFGFSPRTTKVLLQGIGRYSNKNCVERPVTHREFKARLSWLLGARLGAHDTAERIKQ